MIPFVGDDEPHGWMDGKFNVDLPISVFAAFDKTPNINKTTGLPLAYPL